MLCTFPNIIDNQKHKLADVLNQVMREHSGMSLDIASAYFSISGFRLLRENRHTLRSFWLLLGFQPQEAKDVGLSPSAPALHRQLRGDLNAEPYSAETLRLVKNMISYLQRQEVVVRLYENGFLHAKAYLFYGDKGNQFSLFDRLLPLIGIVGSSNFTGPGLLTNKELNLAHKTIIEPEEVDDIHDLLADLAKRMIDLNKSKQAEMKRFLAWLESLFKIDLDDLTGKSKLKNYLGDYQKGEPEVSCAELEDILYKNKAKLGLSLSDSRVTSRLRDEYEKSLAVLRPLKVSLAWTDGVIDQVVYRLYGLTEAEVRVVEGQAGK